MSFVVIGTPPAPLPQASVRSPPPGPKGGGGGPLPAVRLRGWGSPNSDAWRKSLALCLLCGKDHKAERTKPFCCSFPILHLWLQMIKRRQECLCSLYSKKFGENNLSSEVAGEVKY